MLIALLIAVVANCLLTLGAWYTASAAKHNAADACIACDALNEWAEGPDDVSDRIEAKLDAAIAQLPKRRTKRSHIEEPNQ